MDRLNEPVQIDLAPDKELAKKIKEKFPMTEDVRPEVLEALRNGDHKSFDIVYTLYFRLMRNFITALLQDKEEALEVTQDVFAALWEQREKINPEIGIKGYLYQISKGMAYKRLRHREVEDKYVRFMDRSEVDPLRADDEIISKETAILIRIALDRMPEKRRQVFMMHKEQGMSYDEIADLTGLSKNTIRNHIATATKDLKKVITLFWVLFVLG